MPLFLFRKLFMVLVSIPNTTGLVTRTNFNAKTTEIGKKIPVVSAFTKIENISDFVKKTDLDTKITNDLIPKFELTGALEDALRFY